MTGSPETGYDITVTRRVGNMEARLRGRFEMSEVEPGRGCLLTGGGSGGGAGGAKGTARIALVPVGEGTRLSWDIRAELEGKLASVPGFLVNMAARRVAHGFVERFAAEVEHRKVEPRTGLIGRIMGR
jgi:carbon monoxide dehydrogenase subunit G